MFVIFHLLASNTQTFQGQILLLDSKLSHSIKDKTDIILLQFQSLSSEIIALRLRVLSKMTLYCNVNTNIKIILQKKVKVIPFLAGKNLTCIKLRTMISGG